MSTYDLQCVCGCACVCVCVWSKSSYNIPLLPAYLELRAYLDFPYNMPQITDDDEN